MRLEVTSFQLAPISETLRIYIASIITYSIFCICAVGHFDSDKDYYGLTSAEAGIIKKCIVKVVTVIQNWGKGGGRMHQGSPA